MNIPLPSGHLYLEDSLAPNTPPQKGVGPFYTLPLSMKVTTIQLPRPGNEESDLTLPASSSTTSKGNQILFIYLLFSVLTSLVQAITGLKQVSKV